MNIVGGLRAADLFSVPVPANLTRSCGSIFTVLRDEGAHLHLASRMQIRPIIFSALFLIVGVLPALAQSDTAALIDFNHGDKRSAGTVAWRAEQVKTSDGHDDPAVRADVDIPDAHLKLTWLLRRNFDPSLPASHVIELNFTVPPDFIDGGIGSVYTTFLASTEMSGSLTGLLGTVFKTNVAGQFVNALSDSPVNRCKNQAALNDNAWVAVYINGVKRKPNVFRPAVSDQSLWLSKGEAGQRIFDAVFAAWEKRPAAGARGAACHPS
jgi:hypothetical protein